MEYIRPEIEITVFETEDVITLSAGGTDIQDTLLFGDLFN